MLFSNEFDQAMALMGFPQDKEERRIIETNVMLMQERKVFSPWAARLLNSIVQLIEERHSNAYIEPDYDALFDSAVIFGDELESVAHTQFGVNVLRVFNPNLWERIKEEREDNYYSETCRSVVKVTLAGMSGCPGGCTYVVLVEQQMREEDGAEIYPLSCWFEPMR